MTLCCIGIFHLCPVFVYKKNPSFLLVLLTLNLACGFVTSAMSIGLRDLYLNYLVTSVSTSDIFTKQYTVCYSSEFQ
jgi:hypothetical protein